ncbi:uncharacterized protein LOC128738026 [Sabethes cyaneus]|uniref:uncharacterized protein LOC128738026 n=1 Tax=Sabethes cyaneus TaxID=53552 RepID=UPI00237E3267|nr:uncharacterized protein LOC128738026 [Sabethes cyaneus]
MAVPFCQALFAVAFLGMVFAKPFDGAADSNDVAGYPASHAKQFLLTLREACMNRSRSEEGFQQFLTSLPPAMRCLKSHIDLPQMMIDLKTMTQSNRKEVFETYCPKFAESKVCFDDMMQAVATCLAQNTKSSRAILNEMVSGAVDLICKDDGEIFFEARKPEFRSCIKDVRQHIKECKSTKIASTTLWTEYGQEECLELVKARDCLRDKVDACSSLAIMDIVDIYYNPVFKANNCLKIPSTVTDDQGAVVDSWNEV